MKPIFLYPTEQGKAARITQRFGQNLRNYAGLGLNSHNGIDFAPVKAGVDGDPILAIGDGVVFSTYTKAVSKSKDPKAATNFIRIHHPNGYASVYLHLMPGGVLVKPGDKVVAGQIIGKMGSTGYSTGTHLHLSLKAIDKDGNTLNKDNGWKGAIDPMPFLEPAEPKPNASELPIPVKPHLEQWQKDLVEYVKSKELAPEVILHDVDCFISDPTPYKILALCINTNPVLREEYATYVYEKHKPLNS